MQNWFVKCREFSVAFFGLVLFSLALSLPYLNTCGDDSFIYFRLIENFLQTGQLAYNLGEPCYAMTSTTFFFAMAGLVKGLGLTGGRYAISILGHVFAAMMLYGLGRRLVRNRWVLFVALAAILFDPFYLRWFWAGWELSFKIAAAAGALWMLLVAGERRGWRWCLGAGAVVGFAVLTRPEMLVLVGLGGVYLLSRHFPGRVFALIPSLLGYLAGVLLVTVPWMRFAHFYFGWALPHTVYAKASGMVSLEYLKLFFPKFVQILFIPAFPFYVWAMWAGVRVRPLSKWTRAISAGEIPDVRDFLLVAIWAGTLAGYLVRGVYIDGIKVGLFSPFVLLTAAFIGSAATHLLERKWSGRGVWCWVLVLVLMSVGIQSKLFYRFSSWRANYAQGDDIRFINFAKRVKELTPADARIGIAELGVVGYFTGRYMIDYVGLATPQLVQYQLELGEKESAVAKYYERHGGPPGYIVHEFSPNPEEAPGEYEFWGYNYRLVDSEIVQRIAGRAKKGEYSIYALYERVL